MKTVYITGERGFIAQNLARELSLNCWRVAEFFAGAGVARNSRGEMCVFRNSTDDLARVFEEMNVDVVVHNAAVVGTDVVMLDKCEAVRTNVEGTWNVCQAAERLKIPVVFFGTTVVYDDPSSSAAMPISESTRKRPSTLYGVTKLAGENIVTSVCSRWIILRPLFVYGGVGDMNSTIAKCAYAKASGRRTVDVYLREDSLKDYMHVDDFCRAVRMACDRIDDVSNSDFNVAAGDPTTVSHVARLATDLVEIGRDDFDVTWHPDVDYLGDHVLTSQKFRSTYDWKPLITLEDGIARAVDSIVSAVSNSSARDYDPLQHVDRAKMCQSVSLHEMFNVRQTTCEIQKH